MNLYIFWDIENVGTLTAKVMPDTNLSESISPEETHIFCGHAKPFTNISELITVGYHSLDARKLEVTGPDVADFHLLSAMNHIAMLHGRNNMFYLVSRDKLLSYRFIALARNLGIYRHHIGTLVPEKEIRTRSKRGRELFEDGDLDKLPFDIE